MQMILSRRIKRTSTLDFISTFMDTPIFSCVKENCFDYTVRSTYNYKYNDNYMYI